MDQVVRRRRADATPTIFAENVMEIAVPPDNPADVTAVADLAKPASRSRSASRRCPCGASPGRSSTTPKVTVKPVTQEADVKAALDQGDARRGRRRRGLRDRRAAAGDKVKGIEIPADQNASTAYPIAALTKAPNAGRRAGLRRLVLLRRRAEGARRRPASARRDRRRVDAPQRRAPPPGRSAVPAADRRRCSSSLPLVGLLVRAPVAAAARRIADRPDGAARRCGCRWSRATLGHRDLAGARRAAGLGAGPGPASRAGRCCGRW